MYTLGCLPASKCASSMLIADFVVACSKHDRLIILSSFHPQMLKLTRLLDDALKEGTQRSPTNSVTPNTCT